MNKRSMSDMHRCNKMTMITYSVMNFFLIAAYLLEVVKKSRTVGYFMVFCAFALIPYAIAVVMYKRNMEDKLIKYIVAVGFGIFYMFIIFTTVSPIAYVYALLMAVILLCYNDTKLSRNYMIAICLGNIIQVIVMGIQGKITAGDLANLEIRIISVILFGVFMYMASWVVEQNNSQKLLLIESEKEKTENLMNQIMDVSNRLTGDIQVVSEKMNVLGFSADKTRESMAEVAKGTGQTVDTIQIQLEKTEEIQQTVNRVTDASDSITEHVQNTKKELDISQKNIDNLIHHAQLSNEANENVSKELAELYQYTDQMQSIVQMIDEVATQTSLLSLNASIEAARAGEAGRGFAVVASEISSLANQTQQATVTITSLINNISSELKDVVLMIEKMITNAKEQNAVVNNTAESFASIAVKNQKVYEEAGAMNRLVKDLAEANIQIIKGIETISAVTEEVTAHSNETLETTNENHMITSEVGRIVDGLNQLADQLKQKE